MSDVADNPAQHAAAGGAAGGPCAGAGQAMPAAKDRPAAGWLAADGLAADRVAADRLTAEMTAALAAGDESAVEAFYRRYFDLLYRAARRATGRDEAFCLDVVQESVLRVIRAARRVESEGAWSAWLRLVVRTCAYDLLRAEIRRRRREALAAVGRAEVERAGAGDNGAAAAEDDETARRLEWLRGQIARLDPELVRAIDLRYAKRWTLARVAAALGVSVAALDGRLRRALERLRRQARRDWEDDDDV